MVVQKSEGKEKQPEASPKPTLAEKIAEAMTIVHEEHMVDGHPTLPSSVPGGRRRGRKHHLGTIVNKTPHGYEH